MDVNAAPAVQFESFGVKPLWVVPLPNDGRMHRGLVIDRAAELPDLLVVEPRRSLMELGQHLRQRRGLPDGIERDCPVRHHEHQASPRPKYALELTQGRDGIGQVLDHMTGDHGIQGAAGDGGQPVYVEIDAEVGVGTTGEAGKLRPVIVAASCHRTVGIADARAWRDGKWIVTRTDLEDAARERPPDHAARVLPHSDPSVAGSEVEYS